MGSITRSFANLITSDGPSAVANDAVTAGDISGNLNFRNIIINGDMNIAQRGISTTGITSDGYYTVDRFKLENSSSGTFTMSQSTDVPSGQGFRYSTKLDCTTADASPNYLIFQQRIEGQNLQYIKKGTASAESLTLSFWVKCNETGTMQVNIFDADNTRLICKTYTINTADTWEKKTITFAGDTTGTLDYDNARSFQLEWFLDGGATYTGGSVTGNWEAKDNTNRFAGATINLGDNTANEWYITGVQLEVGTTASDFEFLPFDISLSRCQRYYYVIADRRGVANPAIDQRAIGVGITHYVNQMVCEISLPTQMRAHPSYDQITGTNYFDYYHDQNSDYFDGFVGFAQQGRQKVMIRNTNQISADLDTCGQVFIAEQGNAFAALDAEL